MALPEDDTYHGARWRYGLQYRPITQYLGARDLETDEKIPWILFSDRASDDPRFRQFGTFDCAVELSPRTVRQFELVPLGMADDGSGDEHPNLTAAMLKADD